MLHLNIPSQVEDASYIDKPAQEKGVVLELERISESIHRLQAIYIQLDNRLAYVSRVPSPQTQDVAKSPNPLCELSENLRMKSNMIEEVTDAIRQRLELLEI